MRLLLDTHLLIWAFASSDRLSRKARILMDDLENELWFSVISLWEIAVKRTLGRAGFDVDPRLMRRVLLEHGYLELALSGDHALGVETLPPLHKDPFDRILIAQANSEGMTLLTSDKLVSQYPGPILLV